MEALESTKENIYIQKSVEEQVRGEETVENEENKDGRPPAAATATNTSSSIDHPVMNSEILKGMLRTMFTVVEDEDDDDEDVNGSDNKERVLVMSINGREMKLKRVDSPTSIKPGTRHFVDTENKREDLYWYTEYSIIMTSYNLMVEYCALSNGDVVVGVWETRCNNPFVAILLCTASSSFTECVLMKADAFRKRYPNAKPDPAVTFDLSIVEK